MVLEQGKPLAEAIGETVYAANFIQWFAEQSKRILGNIMSDFAKDTTNFGWSIGRLLEKSIIF